MAEADAPTGSVHSTLAVYVPVGTCACVVVSLWSQQALALAVSPAGHGHSPGPQKSTTVAIPIPNSSAPLELVTLMEAPELAEPHACPETFRSVAEMRTGCPGRYVALSTVTVASPSPGAQGAGAGGADVLVVGDGSSAAAVVGGTVPDEAVLAVVEGAVDVGDACGPGVMDVVGNGSGGASTDGPAVVVTPAPDAATRSG